jgi:hypothetical protein
MCRKDMPRLSEFVFASHQMPVTKMCFVDLCSWSMPELLNGFSHWVLGHDGHGAWAQAQPRLGSQDSAFQCHVSSMCHRRYGGMQGWVAIALPSEAFGCVSWSSLPVGISPIDPTYPFPSFTCIQGPWMLSNLYHMYPQKRGPNCWDTPFWCWSSASSAEDTVAEVLCEDCCALGFVHCTFRMDSTLCKLGWLLRRGFPQIQKSKTSEYCRPIAYRHWQSKEATSKREREREREKKTKKGGTDNIKDRSHSQR